jgi:hypothetical protein
VAVVGTKVGKRDVYKFTYEGAENRDGGIVAKFVNAEGEESDYKGLDDGEFVSTVASDYAGEAEVEVTDADGNVIDSGTVSFA